MQSKVRRTLPTFFLFLSTLTLAGCTAQPANEPQISVQITPFATSQSCSATFQTHILGHVTTPSQQIAALYESNGAGVAINDLDNDGDIDIVLANLQGDNTIWWNDGALNFRGHRLAHGSSRAVNIVDVNGDGLLDIVFTRLFDKPTLWRNLGGEQFRQETLPDVNNPFYTMDWRDLDQDGDLDFVAASYDTELRKHQGAIFDYRGGGVGVFVYEFQPAQSTLASGEMAVEHFGTYVAHRLADQADALALLVSDVNRDRRPDILVGNDFARPDFVWLRAGPEPLDPEAPSTNWLAAQPFPATALNTMSYDMGDIDNNGSDEIFATDMQPYATDKETLAAWEPLFKMMDHATEPDDPQIIENVLLSGDADGTYKNVADEWSVDATGWSWSSKFGDFDQDGYLDIYVVNGIIASDFLPHLPNNALVEENQALRNDGSGAFTPAPEWGLGSIASGRGMSMGDLDNDGDLDIVVNNLAAPAQLFENQLCMGSSLQVELHWSDALNHFAIGSRVILKTSTETYQRTVRASSGYLSGDPARVHFGFPTNTEIKQLEIHWPDGVVSEMNVTNSDAFIQVTR